MRRVLGILLDLATVVLGVLCVATIVLWGRSYFARDWVMGCGAIQARHQYGVDVASGTGTMTFMVDVWRFTDALRPGYVARNAKFAGRLTRDVSVILPEDRSAWGWRGLWTFSVDVDRRGPGTPVPGSVIRWVLAPHWFVAALLGVGPGIRVVRWRRRRPVRARRGDRLCVACGYDLRATPGRCRECGVVVAASVR